ncbi:MAG TPA: hypothetical protein VHS81_03250 [Caulobacteraceae bacterium]|nr:hypothetical protein [Caulobacteraceae bacterium]
MQTSVLGLALGRRARLGGRLGAKLGGCVALAASLAGCATHPGGPFPPGISFAPPPVSATSVLPPPSADVAGAIATASARAGQFLTVSDKLANAPQYLDLATIGAGIAALAAGAFGAPSGFAKGAGIAAAALVGHRTYWNFSPRQVAMQAGAAADGCVANTAEGIRVIDGQRPLWLAAAAWATEQVQAAATSPGATVNPMATKVMELEPIVMGAPQQLDSRMLAIEIAVRRKLATPSPPDISTLAATYQAALQEAPARGQSNANASGQAQRMLEETRRPRAMFGAAAAPPSGEQAAATVLADPALLNNLTALSTTLTACVALAN